MSEQGWPELVDAPSSPKEGDRLLIRWENGREESVTVDTVSESDDGTYSLGVTLDPPPNLPEFYYLGP